MNLDMLSQTDWLLVGGGAAAVAWYFRDKIKAMLPLGKADDPDTTDFAAYLRLRKRAAERGADASKAVDGLLVPLFGSEVKA